MKSNISSYSTQTTQEDSVSESSGSHHYHTNNNNNNNNNNMKQRPHNDDEENPRSSTEAAASPYWAIPFESPKTGFSPFVAFCFTINYILGTGFLTIPWAFVQSGLVLSTILMIFSAMLSDIAKDFLLETMARAEAMLDDQLHWMDNKVEDEDMNNKQQKPKGRLLLPPTTKEERERQRLAIKQKKLLLQKEEDGDLDGDDEQELLSYQKQSYDVTRSTSSNENKYQRTSSAPLLENEAKSSHPPPNFEQQAVIVYPKDHRRLTVQKYLVEQRKFEVNALCRVFLGKRGLQLYTIVICLYLSGALWAYTSVFASAMATALPLFDGTVDFNYLCYAILFGCIVVPLSCLELDEQVPLQVCLTLCRFLMFFLMIGTSYWAAQDYEETNSQDGFEPAKNFQWSGLAKTLPILVFANIFHHSIPGLSHPVGDKRMLGKVFSATNIFTVAAYITLGVTLGTTFGKGIQQSSNLNWNGFHAGKPHVDENGKVIGADWWATTISVYIMLFPAVDVVSAYPLNAITLGNNIFGAAYGKRIHEVEGNRFLRTCFRLLASIPPIIFGILVRELGTITDYTGTGGFLIGLCFPSLLYMSSRKLARIHHFCLDTYYTSYGSSVAVAKFILWFGIFMMIFVFTKLTFFS